MTMAADNPNLAAWMSLPEPHDVWAGTDYFGGPFPVGRGQRRPQMGWCCSGCGRGYSPLVRECTHCPEKAEAPGRQYPAGVSTRYVPGTPLGGDEDDD